MNNKLTISDQKNIVENNIKRICADIYNTQINVRVAKKLSEDADIEKAKKALETLEKHKDAFEEILKELTGIETEI